MIFHAFPSARIQPYRRLRIAVEYDLPMVENDAALAKLAYGVHIVADIKHGASLTVCRIVHSAEAFLLELHVAHRKHLVHDHYFRVKVRGNGERKLNIHAR